jgi:hypothetical protein
MEGPSGGVVFSDTIPALSGKDYNTRWKGDFSDALWTNCTSNHQLEPTCQIESDFGTAAWTGAAIVEVNTPGGRIVGVSHVMYDAQYEFSHEAMGPSVGTQIAVCPYMWDRDGGTNWRYSNLTVQNTSNSPATVDIYLFKQSNTTGGLAAADLTLDNSSTGYVIPVGEHIEANTHWDTPYGFAPSDFDSLGNNWEGSAVVVSRDEPIVAAMSIFALNTSTRDYWTTTYNCYNIESP